MHELITGACREEEGPRVGEPCLLSSGVNAHSHVIRGHMLLPGDACPRVTGSLPTNTPGCEGGGVGITPAPSEHVLSCILTPPLPTACPPLRGSKPVEGLGA